MLSLATGESLAAVILIRAMEGACKDSSDKRQASNKAMPYGLNAIEQVNFFM
jgi:hypothetical protein